MVSSFRSDQLEELEKAARSHPDAHIRSRALAVRAVALGHSRSRVAELLPYSSYSIGQWVVAYLDQGLDAFRIAKGRGRHGQADGEEVLSRLRRSPEAFGIDRTRWTLATLRDACPSLAGMCERGVLKVIHRLGFRYKRGQAWIHSPDPQYEEKKTPSKRRIPKRSPTRRRSSS